MTAELAIAVLTPSRAACRVLSHTLERQCDCRVVAAVTDPRAILPLLPGVDVLLLHHSLPHEQAWLIFAAVRHAPTRARPLIIGVPRDGDTIVRYLEQGARGYVLAGERIDRLLEILRRIGRGEVYVDPWIIPHLMRRQVELEQQLIARKLLEDAFRDGGDELGA